MIPTVNLSVNTSRLFLTFKRTVDILTALTLLPVLGVVGLIVWVLNLFFNRGPLFYSQSRVGKSGQTFRILKFRTMIGKNELSKFATDEDCRITPFGRFLRDIHFDELPQIINILRGEMSLIGPRPEQLSFFERYSNSIDNFALRQTVRPGISGLAQLRSGYADNEVSARRKLRWDLEYIQKQGFRIEAYIYLKTMAYLSVATAKQMWSSIFREKYS